MMKGFWVVIFGLALAQIANTALQCGKCCPDCMQEERRECTTAVFDGIEAGWLKPIVGSEYPLEKVVKAHEDIIHCSGAQGKMVLLP